jgi:hypothetical protein
VIKQKSCQSATGPEIAVETVMGSPCGDILDRINDHKINAPVDLLSWN